MYRLTSEIRIGGYVVKPTAVTWRDAVESYRSTCNITLSRRANQRDIISDRPSGDNSISPGAKVEVMLGYDGRNYKRFAGRVKRIVVGSPIVIECEGSAGELDDVLFTRSYKMTTLKQILKDMTAGTGIEVGERVSDVTVKNVTFVNAPGDKVLDWVRKELLCTVSFYGNSLYAGIGKYGVPGKEVKVRLGYNSVSDNELKKGIENNIQRVRVRVKSKNGSVKSYKDGGEVHKYDDTKEFNVRAGLDKSYLDALLDELAKREAYKDYSGVIVLFGEPLVEKGDVINIEDPRWNVRSGRYFVDTVEGSYGSGGYRQKLTIKKVMSYDKY